MPDAMDIAVERIEIQRAADIAAARTPDRPGALICEDCEAPIPEARRIAMPSARRCVPCQEKMETARAR